MYTKRQVIPKFWPIPRKGTKYLATANHEKRSGIPIVVLMREVLKLVKTKKELKKIINEKKILINSKVIVETNFPVSLFDVISIPSVKKYYSAVLNGKRMGLVEISEKESNFRMYKVVNKKSLPKGKVQLNLSSGKNIIISSKDKIDTRSFVLLNIQENKIEKNIALKKGTGIVVISGRHIGKQGEIMNLEEQGEKMIAEISTKEGKDKINVELDNLFALN